MIEVNGKLTKHIVAACLLDTGLTFDVILGFPCIRKYNLVNYFSYLFSESNLQVHNCTKCRQCLPKIFQQESSPSDGETQSKVLLAVPCVDALNILQEPSVPGSSVVEARRSGCPGGHASVPQGLIDDRKASDLAPEQLLWTAGAEVRDPGSSVVEDRRSGCPGGHASVPQGLIDDRKASDLAPARLRGTTGAADGVRRTERLPWRSCVGPTGADMRPKGE